MDVRQFYVVMSRDINSRDDLMIIVSDFYALLFQNHELKGFFHHLNNDTALEHHLEILVDFWDNTLFYSGSYRKNAMTPHALIHKKTPLQATHFKL